MIQVVLMLEIVIGKKVSQSFVVICAERPVSFATILLLVRVGHEL